MRWGKLLFSIVALVSFFATPLMATIINVPGDQPSIQAGIDAAVNGDTVLVAPGKYVEIIDFKGKGITVTSVKGPASTFIDGNQAGSVVIFNTGEGLDSILEGFTITNGSGTLNSTYSWYDGGGIYIISASPTIIENIVTDNAADHGGGILLFDSVSLFMNNIIINNHASGASGDGGAVKCGGSNPTFINNVFAFNSATHSGGGIRFSGSSATITNNVFFGNTTGHGGAIHCRSDCVIDVNNSILWNNSCTGLGKEICLGDTPSPSTLSINYSCVEGGESLVYVTSGATLNWGLKMIDADPLFVDSTLGDYHLTYTSPCKDTGDNTAVTEFYDYEGDPRIANCTVDMGADEFHRHLYWTGDATPGGSVTVNVIDDPNTYPVFLLISFGLLNPPIFLPKHGYWNLQFPVYGPLSLGPIQSNGVNNLTIPIIASAPSPLTIYTQALSGNDLTNLSVLEIE